MVKKILHNGPGILLGLPTLGRPVSLDWAFMFKAMSPPINYNVHFHVVKGKEVADARNDIVKKALDCDAKYLFFLGDDVLVPNHGLRQLIFRMEQDDELGVVGGVYCNKADPCYPLVFRENGAGAYWDWTIGEYFPVTGMGMDCTLIRTDLFKDLEEPYFKTIDVDKYLDGINECEQWTEDLYFLEKVKKTDWKVYIDGSILCGHEDVYGGRIYTLPPGSKPFRVKAVYKEKKCLVIGPATKVEEEYDITRVGDDEEAHYRGFLSLPFESHQFDKIIVSAPSCYMPEALRVAKPGAPIVQL